MPICEELGFLHINEIKLRFIRKAKKDVPRSGGCNRMPERFQSIIFGGYELILFSEVQDSNLKDYLHYQSEMRSSLFA